MAFFGPASLLMRITLDAKYGIYPAGEQVGELEGFPAPPAGLCSDPSGNIYVTTDGDGQNINQSYVYEYAHGGERAHCFAH